MKDEPVFDHEKLYVYRLSIEFQAWVGELLDEGFGARPKPSAMKHLDDASASISNNIAEGNGARTSPDGQTGAPSHRVDAAQASNEALS